MKIQIVLTLVVCLLAGCASPVSTSDQASIEIKDAWVRLAPDTGDTSRNAALYMLVENHAQAEDELLRVETSAAHMASVHLSEVDSNGVASMHEVPSVEIPANGSVEFKPGGYHVMLMGLTEDIQVESTASFMLVFKNAGVIQVEVEVRLP